MKLLIYMVSAVLATVATAKSCTTEFGTGECAAGGSICVVTQPLTSNDCPGGVVRACTTSSGVGECSGAGSICLVTKPLAGGGC
ncbi:uncharacterized protein LY79DRAFT_572047 [Colletotrichum navitas]|uniref:Uncharacterized protein n=1 Tax=Colletotrichum navitas TaxID=681940 RepID=A0AAD8PL99_9PEZI|nr:uncharacterized protein LY79DRAFT_572047 [Colletotrichum navitas]KAK1569349.1 hypothetical protein LY79DRAFT_572047 [Colletotrichum navitas]